MVNFICSRDWGDLGQSATVNEYVDNTIDMLVPLIVKHGLDPMDLPEVVEGFEVVSSFLFTYLCMFMSLSVIIYLPTASQSWIEPFVKKLVSIMIDLYLSYLPHIAPIPLTKIGTYHKNNCSVWVCCVRELNPQLRCALHVDPKKNRPIFLRLKNK